MTEATGYIHKCFRRDDEVHQTINENGLLPYDSFSWNKEKKRQWVIWIRCHGTLLLFTCKMAIIPSNYVLCARWVLFVTPDSSSCLLCCSMRVLPPPLLVLNCLSCSPPGGLGPPPFPPPRLTPFPSGSRHLPASSSDTISISDLSQNSNSLLFSVSFDAKPIC